MFQTTNQLGSVVGHWKISEGNLSRSAHTAQRLEIVNRMSMARLEDQVDKMRTLHSEKIEAFGTPLEDDGG